MSYGLTLCGACRRPRIADRSKSTSTCPYCGCTERTGKLNFFFTSEDQNEVRAALARATGADEFMPDPAQVAAKRKRMEESDPHSTMVYRYEHAADLDEKMDIISQGLTSIKGEFTLNDVEDVVGARAEKMLSAMLDRGFVYETRPGFYKARRHLGMSDLFFPSMLRTSRMIPGSLLHMTK